MSAPKYIIRKPMVDLPIGDIIEKPYDEADYYCKIGTHPDGSAYVGTVRIDKETVERNPDWFQLIEKKRWTDSDLLAFANWHYKDILLHVRDIAKWLEWRKQQ